MKHFEAKVKSLKASVPNESIDYSQQSDEISEIALLTKKSQNST